ncbi:LysR family glycine cleavage system transcriptional activator [Neorhizobium galegae]|uniref:LysR substrate-binding domain-containing protein n=1 Tax=Neorhizobium galegae TaxID=399 RepID=UPI001AE52CCA|nr:LysR substrate-binding domain-containing protein [Neorhizobium galegae]MBP2548776.1 LysR family glycine cleavage system transcriptional activator [Neorhizobium galegae]
MKLSRKVPLNAIRVFESVARLGSFTRAGEELGMTQTAVSYQIRLLEEHVGEMLFLRQARRSILTATGERMLPKIVDAFALLTDALADAREQADGILEIRSTPTFASHWLARHIGAFQLQHPGLAVRILRMDKPAEFSIDNADVAIWRGERPPADMEAQELFRLTYAPMLSPKLAETIGGATTPADLLKLPLIGASSKWWGIWFRSNGIDTALPSTITIDADGALDLEGSAAIAGHGVALLSPFLHREELEAGRLILPFDVFKTDDLSYWLISPKSRRKSAKVIAFREWIAKTLPAWVSPGQ